MQQSTAHLTMEATTSALRSQIGTLNHENLKLQAEIGMLKEANMGLEAENGDLESQLREAEMMRRKLHNEIQELRGNIRVFVRVRPNISNDAVNGSTTMATIRYPNEREATEIEILASGESATGTVTMRNHHFTFDRIFTPRTTQLQVFEEVAHLTQSVLDGYNVSPKGKGSKSLLI
jgi:kinesin family protein C1